MLVSWEEFLLHSPGRLLKLAISFPAMENNSSFDSASAKTFKICRFKHPSSQHLRKMPSMAFAFSVESSIRFNITCIMLVYVTLSGFNPIEGRELYAEAAMCMAFCLFFEVPVTLAQVFILSAKTQLLMRRTRTTSVFQIPYYSQYVE